MNRREAMKKVSVLRVASLSVSTIVVFQQGCLTSTDRMLVALPYGR